MTDKLLEELNFYKHKCLKLEDVVYIQKEQIRQMMNKFLIISRKTDSKTRIKLLRLNNEKILEVLNEINEDVKEYSQLITIKLRDKKRKGIKR